MFMLMLCVFLCVYVVGYTTKDLVFMWQSGDPVQMDEISLPQFDVKQEDIKYGNCTKFYQEQVWIHIYIYWPLY